MFPGIFDDLSRISFEMIRIFDERVASAGKCVLGHKHDRTPGTNFSNGVYTPLTTMPTRITLRL